MVADTYLLFEPDIIVPSRFFATLRRQAPSKRGEYRLLVAVLQEAIDCFQKNVHATNKWRQRRFDEVQSWITGEDGDTASHEDHVPGLSFEDVCDVLGLDAAYLPASGTWKPYGRTRRRLATAPECEELPGVGTLR